VRQEASSVAEAAPARGAPTLPASALERIGPPFVLVLATAALDGTPATTLVSWVFARDPSALLVALDRRGLGYRNATENPAAALEILLDGFAATARGRLTLLRDELRHTPFPCAAFLLEVDEVRQHATPGVAVAPARYEFDRRKPSYARNEAAVMRELRALAAGREL